MATERGKMSSNQGARGAARRRQKRRRRSPSSVAFSKVGRSTDQACSAAEQLAQRIIDLEAALDFYGYGTNLRGELEPMSGEEYAKAMAKDGGEIARAYLKDRFDREYFGAPNKNAPGGWGVRYSATIWMRTARQSG